MAINVDIGKTLDEWDDGREGLAIKASASDSETGASVEVKARVVSERGTWVVSWWFEGKRSWASEYPIRRCGSLSDAVDGAVKEAKKRVLTRIKSVNKAKEEAGRRRAELEAYMKESGSE